MKESGFLLTETLGYSCEFSVHSQDPTFLLPTLEGVYQSEQTVLTGVYTEEGALIYGQDKSSDDFVQDISTSLINKISKGERAAIKRETSSGVAFYDFFVPIKSTGILPVADKGEIIGVARIGISLEKIKEDLTYLVFWGIIINLIVGGLMFFLARVLASTITKPINTLTEGAREFGKGNLKHKIEVKTNDEIGNLAQAFNEMTENLKESQESLKEAKSNLEVKVREKTKELREINQELEERVKERTEELEKRVNELEKFHKLTVGRELKMTELKKEIEKLKNKKEKLEKEIEEEDN